MAYRPCPANVLDANGRPYDQSYCTRDLEDVKLASGRPTPPDVSGRDELGAAR